MTPIFNRSLAFCGVLAFIASLFYAQLGFDWIDEGHGLHPAIAFGMVGLCWLIGYQCLINAIRRSEEQRHDNDLPVLNFPPIPKH